MSENLKKLRDLHEQLLRAEIKRIKEHEERLVDGYQTVEYEVESEHLSYVDANLADYDCTMSTFIHALLHVRELLRKDGMIEIVENGTLVRVVLRT